MRTRTQFVRYVIIGLVSNGALFLCYLLLTAVGVGHKSAMTGLYALGVAQTFLANRKWSFRHRGAPHGAFARYVTAYAAGYFLNLAALVVAADMAGYPHQVVQGVMALVLAVLLFLAQKYWVFRVRTPALAEGRQA